MGQYYPAICLLTTLNVFGQVSDMKSARLDGIVLDSITDHPVKKAAVLLRKGGAAPEGLAVVTDATGHFEISGLSPGAWMAEVHRDGYATLGMPAPGQ